MSCYGETLYQQSRFSGIRNFLNDKQEYTNTATLISYPITQATATHYSNLPIRRKAVEIRQVSTYPRYGSPALPYPLEKNMSPGYILSMPRACINLGTDKRLVRAVDNVAAKQPA
jgi:hypothetical protein